MTMERRAMRARRGLLICLCDVHEELVSETAKRLRSGLFRERDDGDCEGF